jgi:hypothetical protein
MAFVFFLVDPSSRCRGQDDQDNELMRGCERHFREQGEVLASQLLALDDENE